VCIICLYRGLKREDVRRGQVLSAPDTVKAYKKFKAEVSVMNHYEDGRHTPFFTHYRCVIMIVMNILLVQMRIVVSMMSYHVRCLLRDDALMLCGISSAGCTKYTLHVFDLTIMETFIN